MLQVRRGLDLGEEPLGADDGGELRAQHLDRDLAIVLQVLGEIDGRHAAGAELALDAVAVGEARGEAFDAHRGCLLRESAEGAAASRVGAVMAGRAARRRASTRYPNVARSSS